MKTHMAPLVSGLTLLLPCLALAATTLPELEEDPHHNALGFFDMHLCNWPERPQFFKVLFSTTRFDQVAKMVVYDPAGRELVQLDKNHFIPLEAKGKPPKRVYLQDIDLPGDVHEGLYRIEVTDTRGGIHEARDLVPLTRIQRPTGLQPANDLEDVPLPVKLSWDKVPGAQFYQVFLRNGWDQQKVFQSDLIPDTSIEVPAGKLEPGGYYSWLVHARDVNEHVLLGDFHNGSTSEKAYFFVAE